MNVNYTDFDEKAFIGEEATPTFSKSITPMTILLSILKRPWIIGLTLLLIMVPVGYYISTAEPSFYSSAVVIVSIRGVSFMDMLYSPENQGKYSYKTESYYTSILNSVAFEDDIVDHILILYPSIPRDSLRNVVRGSVGFKKDVKAEGFITINAYSKNREFALFLTEVALEQFKNRVTNLEKQDMQNVVNFIDAQLALINKKLENAEEGLLAFLTEKKLLVEDLEKGVGKGFFNLEKKLSEAQAKLEMDNLNIKSYEKQIVKLLDQLTGGYKKHDNEKFTELKSRVDEINKMLDNSIDYSAQEQQILRDERKMLLKQLSESATIANPNKEMNRFYSGMTLQNLEEELALALIAREKHMNEVSFYEIQLERYNQEHPNLTKDMLEYASIIRNKDVLIKTMDILLGTREEARIKVAGEQGGVKVIDEPRLPERPLPQQHFMKLIMGVCLGLGLGVLISVVVDFFDNTVKDENDVTQHLGLTVFGTVPALIPNEKTSRSKTNSKIQKGPIKADEAKMLTNYSEKSPIAEAYRSLKTSIQFIAQDKSKKIFTVSSPGSSEGKSLTTVNVGISFAQGGRRTLIIDGDLRRPTQHRYFDFHRRPGLTNYLFEEVQLSEILRETSVPNLFLITSGNSPPNPAELVSSRKMKSFLEEISAHFDVILIDTPPIMACVDSRVIAEMTDGMILLAQVESTNIRALDHAVKLCQRLNVEILGVILNLVEFKYGYSYYYAYRYYNPFSYYYYSGSYYYYEESEDGKKGKKFKRKKGEVPSKTV